MGKNVEVIPRHWRNLIRKTFFTQINTKFFRKIDTKFSLNFHKIFTKFSENFNQNYHKRFTQFSQYFKLFDEHNEKISNLQV